MDERKPCSADGCDKPSVARGWCRTHYSQWQRKGVVGPIREPLGPPTCQYEDCGEPSVGRGLCRKHYGRWHRYGDPAMVKPNARAGKGHAGCDVEGCPEPHLAKGFCKNHYRKFEKWGDPLYEWVPPKGEEHPSWKPDDRLIDYALAHDRVRKRRGNADRHLCVDCGSQADEWSYIGGDPDEAFEFDRRRKWMPYSLKPQYYAPRCKSCHARFDKRR